MGLLSKTDSRLAQQKGMKSMLVDLKKIKKECCPTEVEAGEDTSGFDKFQLCEYECAKELKNLEEGIGMLEEEKKKGKARGVDQIRLCSDNQKSIKKASALWGELQNIEKDDRKNSRRVKKLGEKELRKRGDRVVEFGQKLQGLIEQNRRAPAQQQEEKQQQHKSRFQQRNQSARQKRQDRNTKRTKANKTKGKIADITLDDGAFRNVNETQEERDFQEQVQINVAEQDEILEQILNGLTELGEIGDDIGKTLDYQKELIDHNKETLDEVSQKFEMSNERLQHILDEQGGASRWCPRMICFILLVALFGYCINLFM